jgi:hypothetical protein
MDLESREAVWAVIRGETVVNTVVWDGESAWSPPEGSTLVPLADYPHVCIGWDYVDGQFIDNRPVEEATTDPISEQGDD